MDNASNNACLCYCGRAWGGCVDTSKCLADLRSQAALDAEMAAAAKARKAAAKGRNARIRELMVDEGCSRREAVAMASFEGVGK